MNESLTGVRVLDVTTNVAGPFATQILGDLGADVIKVERPGSGDDVRGWGPPFWANGEGVTFTTLNRNKRSIALDLRDEADRVVFEALVESADVLVQNLRPGALDKLGYSWDALHARNPRLIYAEMSGFGHIGPKSRDAAYDPLMQAYSGLMSLTGEAGRPPVRIPVSILDKGTGMWTAIGILNALRNRDASGEGSLVQTSLLDTALQWEPGQLLGYIATGETPEPTGSGAAMIAPYQAFEAADGHIIVAAGNERLWAKLCVALQRPELLTDTRFVDNASRVRHRDELTATLTQSLVQNPVAHWVKVLGEAGVPCTPILRIDSVVEEEQIRALGSLERVPHPDVPAYTQVHLPVFTNGERFAIRSVAPPLDADGESIRAEIRAAE